MNDEAWMREAIRVASSARLRSSPNPWVGCVVVRDDEVFTGATMPPGGAHAERVALDAAGQRADGATAYVTLEPCAHHGRTPPCADALIEAGVRRVVVAVIDPDPHVSGSGIERLRSAGVEVIVGVEEDAASRQLAPYLHHRRTGRPFVVLKLASTLDGRTAAPDGTSQWITSHEARVAAHQLRAESDAICVGAGTVRSDDPSLTTRLTAGPNPRRVVLGKAPPSAAVHPCIEWTGSLGGLLDRLGSDGVLQLLVEGGPTTAASFHREQLVDRYVLYQAPALMGGDDGLGLFAGPGADTLANVWRGQIISCRPLGPDLEIVIEPEDDS
jgi:diaminohydroxyphosphoribosylaminopyrimidine deaminase/5-amino-6-(5-phosphoribosylamino)uracil reductase